MIEQHFDATITKRLTLKYLLFLPQRYSQQQDARFPLLLYLHGSGERGDNTKKLLVNGLPHRLMNWSDCPFIVIMPQCSLHSMWTLEIDALDTLLTTVTERFRVDMERQYITGLSMGGTGVYLMVTAFPDRFAAMAPICGRGIGNSLMANLKTTPAWIFHGAQDTIVPMSESERMAQAIREVGGSVRLTIYPEARHDSWTAAYADPSLYEWLLEYRRR